MSKTSTSASHENRRINEPPKKRFKRDWLPSVTANRATADRPRTEIATCTAKATSPLSKPHTIFENGTATPIYKR